MGIQKGPPVQSCRIRTLQAWLVLQGSQELCLGLHLSGKPEAHYSVTQGTMRISVTPEPGWCRGPEDQELKDNFNYIASLRLA